MLPDPVIGVSCDDAAKPQLIDSCTVTSTALFFVECEVLSHM